MSKFAYHTDEFLNAVKTFENDKIDLEITPDRLILSDVNQKIELKNIEFVSELIVHENIKNNIEEAQKKNTNLNEQ